MPLSVLPPISLSSAREFVKFEVTCTGRPVPTRPVLPSFDSFGSTSTSSTDTSTSVRRNRPSLSPEALLIHAFGPSALSSIAPPVSAGSAAIEQQVNPSHPPPVPSKTPARSHASSHSSSSFKKRRKERHDVHPAPPPRGTFRSVARPTRTSPPLEGKLPLTELIPFRSPRDDTPGEVKRHAAPCECECDPEREFPIPPELWREKVEERLERRKLLRSKFRVEKLVSTPVVFDCRRLETCIAVPPRPDVSRRESPGLRQRNHSSPTLKHLVSDGEKRPSVDGGEESRSADDASPRRNSMVEMQDIDGLIKQCESMSLEKAPG